MKIPDFAPLWEAAKHPRPSSAYRGPDCMGMDFSVAKDCRTLRDPWVTLYENGELRVNALDMHNPVPYERYRMFITKPEMFSKMLSALYYEGRKLKWADIVPYNRGTYIFDLDLNTLFKYDPSNPPSKDNPFPETRPNINLYIRTKESVRRAKAVLDPLYKVAAAKKAMGALKYEAGAMSTSVRNEIKNVIDNIGKAGVEECAENNKILLYVFNIMFDKEYQRLLESDHHIVTAIQGEPK